MFCARSTTAIEVKATAVPKRSDLKGLHAIAEELTNVRRFLFCNVEKPQVMHGVEVLPWAVGLGRLWADRL